jgi:DNA replication and repair protein RecF
MRLKLASAPVVLTGMNGSGKTNILEAISLLVPGRGLCRASSAEWQNHDESLPWAVAAEVRTSEGDVKIGTGRDPAAPDNGRRVVHVDGRAVKGQQALAEHVAMAWVTPDLDRVLADGSAARRKLLDRMVYSFDPAHAGRVHRYEKAMRERLRLLRDGVADATWLAALEDTMAQTGVSIAAARLHLLRQLQSAMTLAQSAFPQAEITLVGMAEEALADQPALLVEDKLRAALARSRQGDAQSGTCAIGVHRSDLLVIHRAHNCPAELCSTGEQKALLVAIMLAFVRTLTVARGGHPPLFLLDDITAHLDGVRRAALFEEILALRVQAWLTGTDEAFFDAFLPYAQHFSVEKGRVTGG